LITSPDVREPSRVEDIFMGVKVYDQLGSTPSSNALKPERAEGKVLVSLLQGISTRLEQLKKLGEGERAPVAAIENDNWQRQPTPSTSPRSTRRAVSPG